jgi:hypothetical protein
MMSRTAWTFLLAVVTLSVGALSASAGQFEKAAYYGAGHRPSEVAVGDLNNDGKADLIFADWLSNQIVILLGNGDGSFQKPITILAPSPTDLALGDLNGDGNLDLVVTESGGSGSGTLAVYLGEGNGHFRLRAKYTLGAYAGAVTVADFDGDGKLDVAAVDEGSGSSGVLRIFPGTGKGTLGRPTVYKAAVWLGAPAAGDLGGGHLPDLAVTEPMDGSVAVFLNDGTGKFLKPVTYNAGGGEVVDVQIADLRNDGNEDLVIANFSLSAIGVLLNKGNGTFEPVKLYHPQCYADAVVIADFNLDGHLDVAVAAQQGNSALLYGKGDGTFGSPVVIKDEIGTDGGYSIASGNFITGDQAPDLAIPIQDDGKVAIMLNTQ